MNRVNQYLVSLDGKAVTADRPTTERLLRENELLWLDLEHPDADGLALLHHVLDALIDSFFPALSDFDDRIDDLQQQIFAKPSNEQLSQLFAMQKWLVGLRKLVTPQRDAMASLVSGVTGLPGMTPAVEPYLRICMTI